MTEEALRELMYEEAHHYRRNLRGKQADLLDDAMGGDGRQRKEEESRQEEAQLRNELMDQNILRG